MQSEEFGGDMEALWAADVARRNARRRQRRWRQVIKFLAFAAWTFLAWSLGARWQANHNAQKVVTVQTPPPAPRYPDPPGIVLHDSDSPAKVDGVPVNAAALEEIHAKEHPDWATNFEGKTYHIAYHYIILPDGTVEQGRPDHCRGAHARKHNDWIGICLVGGFSTHRHWYPERPTSEQMTALIALCQRLMSTYHIPLDRVKRHRDVNLTYCPGDRFPYEQIMQTLRPGGEAIGSRQ